jgi:hypothetical protein
MAILKHVAQKRFKKNRNLYNLCNLPDGKQVCGLFYIISAMRGRFRFQALPVLSRGGKALPANRL